MKSPLYIPRLTGCGYSCPISRWNITAVKRHLIWLRECAIVIHSPSFLEIVCVRALFQLLLVKMCLFFLIADLYRHTDPCRPPSTGGLGMHWWLKQLSLGCQGLRNYGKDAYKLSLAYYWPGSFHSTHDWPGDCSRSQIYRLPWCISTMKYGVTRS